MSGNFREVFGLDDQDDGTYHAWRNCQQGSTMYLNLVPAKGSGEKIWYIPYLQAISIELNAEGTMLCLMCHSTNMTIFIEGQGLDELAKQVSEKRAKSVHVFDAEEYPQKRNSAAVVTKITVEPRSV